MELKTNDKRTSVLEETRTGKHSCCKTGQSQINHKYIFRASENFRINQLKFQKEEKVFYVGKDFYLSFPCRRFLILGAC